MQLKQALSQFIRYVETQRHVTPLLPLLERCVTIQFGEECYVIHISKDKLYLSSDTPSVDRLVVKEEKDLYQLLAGEEQLQVLVRRRGLEYKGTYRTLLLLESLCHLCKPLSRGA